MEQYFHRRKMAMKKNPHIFLHRLLLWGVLVFGASLLILNALVVINADSETLLTDIRP